MDLESRWNEGCPVLFDYVNYMWDEVIDQLQITTVKKNEINLEYKSEIEF